MSKKHKSTDDALKFIAEKIKDGSVRNINQETGIGCKDILCAIR